MMEVSTIVAEDKSDSSTVPSREQHDKEEIIKEDDEKIIHDTTCVDLENRNEPFTIFTTAKLFQFLIIVSLTGMISPFTGSVYMPALNQIENDLGITTEQVNLTITVYMIFQGLSPTFWGTMSDSLGRRPILISTMLVFCAACIGCALSPNYAALVVFRMFQAFGSSSVIAIAAGVLSDIVQSDRRGTFYAFYSLGQFLGPVLGPVLGGIISQYLGWRWIFWILLIMGGTSLISVYFIVPETLRTLVGNGSGYANPTPTQWLARRRGKVDEEKVAAIKEKYGPPRKINFLSPFIYLLEPDIFLALWVNAMQFTGLYSYMSSTTKQFSIHYPWLTELEIGCCFLCQGVGVIMGSFIQGKVLDRNYRIRMEQFKAEFPNKPVSEFPIHKTRLEILWKNLVMTQISTILYGWMLYIKAPLPVPLVLQFLFGIAGAGVMNTSNALLVDLFPGKGASITASNNLMRCILGATATVYIDPAIESIGTGLTFTIIALLLMTSNILVPVLIKYGPLWRRQRSERQNDTTGKKLSLLNRIRRFGQ